MKIGEQNLAEEIKNRNSAALEYAINNYGKLIYKIVYNILNSFGDKESIQECVSDVFTAVWYNIKTYDNEKASFKSWIIAISKYKAIDYRKKLMKNSNIENINDYNIAALNETEEYILAAENKDEIIKIIKELGIVDCEIFIRRYFLEESIENIARSLGLTRQAIDNRLWRGRKRLKEKMISKVKKERI
ncbi:sigma-70 family RNA polymerase sigma factor [Clostridium beijerinckii]|uniref:sigma-70 family RNA polymerase sigma factor n=2 Tax=Clostridium beijerinckii TaxID=1520 RepID=UPI000A1C78C3|nr:sigma-70 family RNA polymerase sigma factor [Clostridium beijerinckii]MBA8934290.1 RNA polymerase sigma-70 factor (ECF subfamily) [Clostridium beijerinckii]NRU38482.1 RNA polymerase sigma-70 factor (ECF subfamily) [Clostridium beijerinckii]NSA98239.1 RNA polymerase sigma-70 factor (ECF subfamily) [Clostridium beijerinckii]CUU48913.1 RNA polymerase factor sigma-70 [Clostridium beijerinckii]